MITYEKNQFKRVIVDTGFLSWNDGGMEISAKSVSAKYAKKSQTGFR